MVRYIGKLALMNDVRRQCRRQGTLKKPTMQVIPEDLVKNAVIIRSVEAEIAM
jgi:hypothetical protein